MEERRTYIQRRGNMGRGENRLGMGWDKGVILGTKNHVPF